MDYGFIRPKTLREKNGFPRATILPLDNDGWSRVERTAVGRANIGFGSESIAIHAHEEPEEKQTHQTANKIGLAKSHTAGLIARYQIGSPNSELRNRPLCKVNKRAKPRRSGACVVFYRELPLEDRSPRSGGGGNCTRVPR